MSLRRFAARIFGGTRALVGAVCCPLMSTPAVAGDAVIHRTDFGGDTGIPTVAWLEREKFILKHDAGKHDKIHLSQSEGALHVTVKKAAFGLIIHEQDVPGARHVRLHWGVSHYPEGASYERGVDDEAILVYVFFGHEKFSSGELFVPDSPYFIGFFLCQDGSDTVEKANVGHHYSKTGRYICVDHPGPNETVVTELDLGEEFRKSFGRADVPDVSGISIEVDTTHGENDGTAAAYLKRIEFLK